MSRFYVAPSGVSLDSIRPGETPTNAVGVNQLLRDDFVGDGLRIIFLPGTYTFQNTIDLSSFTDISVQGDGKVIVDGKGILVPAFKLGSNSSIASIRFKDCLIPVEVVDGSDEILVANCFDYQFAYDISAGQSFTAKQVTNCTFKNLTSRRNGVRISALKGTEVINCLSVGIDDEKSPGFFGEILDRFEDNEGWSGSTPNASYSIQRLPDLSLLKSDALFFIVGNASGSPQHVRVQRNIASSVAWDISRGNIVTLSLFLKYVSGLASSLQSYRFFFGSPAGEVRFDVSDIQISSGFNLLEFDLDSPSNTTGVFDPSNVTDFAIEAELLAGGTVQYALDFINLEDSSLLYDFNVGNLGDTSDPYGRYRGANGFTSDDFPPPFESPMNSRFNYNSLRDHFQKYMIGGNGMFPIGGIYQGSHFITPEKPRHFTFENNVLVGPWYNDESFFNTTTQLPGSEGEGFAENLNDLDFNFVPVDGETVNLTDSSEIGFVRDLDDGLAKKFDKVAGVSTESGLLATHTSSVDASVVSAIGVSGEIYIPPGNLVDIVGGIKITVRSALGEISQTKPVGEIHGGFNDITVLFASPEASSGTFDSTAITEIEIVAVVDPAANIVGFYIDHFHFPVIDGPSTAPILFSPDGNVGIDIDNFPEGEVARVLSAPFLCRNVGDFLRAIWAAVENADSGAFINVLPFQQDLTTRAIEVRFSEIRPSLYGSLSGGLSKDWTQITRLNKIPSPGKDLWVQARLTLRNRTCVPIS